MEKVVANRSFFGAGIDAKKGQVLEVSTSRAKSWVKAGLVRKATADEAKTAKVTTPTFAPVPAPSYEAPEAPVSEDEDGEETDEVVTEPENTDENANDGGADKEPTTSDEVKTDDEPTAPEAPSEPTEPETTTEPEAPVVPLAPVDGGKEVAPPTTPTTPHNNKSKNAKKGSK